MNYGERALIQTEARDVEMNSLNSDAILIQVQSLQLSIFILKTVTILVVKGVIILRGGEQGF